MQNRDEFIQQLSEQNAQLVEKIRWLKERLDIALNAVARLQEENQRLKDEIATLKGQKPRPKIPPSIFCINTMAAGLRNRCYRPS